MYACLSATGKGIQFSYLPRLPRSLCSKLDKIVADGVAAAADGDDDDCDVDTSDDVEAEEAAPRLFAPEDIPSAASGS